MFTKLSSSRYKNYGINSILHIMILRLIMRELLLKIALLILMCLRQGHSEEKSEGLFLTHVIKNEGITAAREESIVDMDLLLGIHSHSGFITVNEEYDSNLFFWYFPHKDVTNVPWIIWLNGGPGASSMIGLFDEIGPVKIEDGKVKMRSITWASDYSLLFIDNPVGAGFSFTRNVAGYATNADQVGKDLYEFLQQFLEMFPEQIHSPLFIAGQSYAGKYAPAFAMEIHRHKNQSHPIKLKGISLGNPLIDPRNMMYYSALTSELGLLQDEALEQLLELENSTIELIDHGSMVDAANKFNETIEFIKSKSGVSIYNFLKDPKDLSSEIESFIKEPEVRQQIHVGNEHFDLNNQLVYEKMLPDIVNSSKAVIEELLDSYGVMCYHGQLDLFVPYSLSKRVYDRLQWEGREEFLKSPRKRLRHYPDEKVVAFKKAGGNFMEIMIRGCGHMVPSEEPELAKFVIDVFVNMFKNTPLVK